MLWYKAWLETRWRFLIGLAVLVCSAMGVVFTYPRIVALLPAVSTANLTGFVGERVKEAAELERTYRGYLWYQWFHQNMAQMGTFFAVLLGTGGLLSQSSGGAAIFTLSMPASRQRLVGVRAAAGLAEWGALALLPQLLLALVSPAVGQTFGVANALVHAICAFAGGAVFLSLAILLSTEFSDVWRPLLIAVAIAVGAATVEAFAGQPSAYAPFGVMSGELYFRTGHLPWLGLLVATIEAGALLYAASVNIARRDF
jgi:hypothetical protein